MKVPEDVKDLVRLVPGLRHPLTVEPTDGRVRVRLGGRVIAESTRALTLEEASKPPVQYLPLAAVDTSVLRPSGRTSYCPYKGRAVYASLEVDGHAAEDAMWSYRSPYDAVADIADHVAFHPDRVDSIEVHHER